MEGALRDAFRRMAPRKTPGPDGIAGKIWTLAREVLGEPLKHLYSRYPREGVFPSAWKEARLVLLPKEGRGWEPFRL